MTSIQKKEAMKKKYMTTASAKQPESSTDKSSSRPRNIATMNVT
jgi:hypothetical protein